MCAFMAHGALQVYFTDLKYTKVEASAAYTFLALLCDIGGALGLILGSTLLTVVELMDIAASVAARYWALRCTRQQCRSSSSER
jgi:Amiloride-sensitive sodium channel